MHQSAYTGISPLQVQNEYIGGICKWWYIPVEHIDVWPAINPLTQELTEEPTLKPDKLWFGPIKVSKRQLGLDENYKESGAGDFWELSVEGFQGGDGRQNRVNLNNMVQHRYIIVAKLRAGGMYIVIGTPWSPLDFAPSFKSGKNAEAVPGSTFKFTGESISKPPVLPSFNNDNSTAMIKSNDAEIIEFTDESQVVINWNAVRKTRFGLYPEIEVWINDGTERYKENSSTIKANLPYPNTTQFTIDLTGPATGWIVIK